MKACKMCAKEFQPRSSLAQVCSSRCALRSVKATKQTEKEQTRTRRLALKSRAEFARDAQSAVNRYVRLRDARLGCASCDRPASWNGQWHASHFRSVGAASAVRFHLWNIHKACSICNNHLSGNLAEYEPRLRARIGGDRVDWLRTQNHRADYSREYLERIKRVFTKRANRLEKRRD